MHTDTMKRLRCAKHNSKALLHIFVFSYRGHVPTMKFDYGETYANHTQKYFQDFRSKALETSKTNYCKGGYFPTFYSYNPDIAISARSRKWDRWLAEPRYALSTLDYDRKEELITFDKVRNLNNLCCIFAMYDTGNFSVPTALTSILLLLLFREPKHTENTTKINREKFTELTTSSCPHQPSNKLSSTFRCKNFC